MHFTDGATPALRCRWLCSLPVPGVRGCVQPGPWSQEERKGGNCYESFFRAVLEKQAQSSTAATISLYPVQDGFVFFLLLFADVSGLDGSSFGFSFKELLPAAQRFESGIIIKAGADCCRRPADRNCSKKHDPPHREPPSPRDGNFRSGVWPQPLRRAVKVRNGEQVFFLGPGFPCLPFTDEGGSEMIAQEGTLAMKSFVRRILLVRITTVTINPGVPTPGRIRLLGTFRAPQRHLVLICP